MTLDIHGQSQLQQILSGQRLVMLKQLKQWDMISLHTKNIIKDGLVQKLREAK